MAGGSADSHLLDDDALRQDEEEVLVVINGKVMASTNKMINTFGRKGEGLGGRVFQCAFY